MIKTRINPYGILFKLIDRGEQTVVIAVDKNKSLIFDLPMDKLMQCWYNWQMKGEVIQEAFPDLLPEHREFLMTTITPDEWKKIFQENRDVSI